MGLFSLGESLQLDSLDPLAAALLPPRQDSPAPPNPEHWSVSENAQWQWYERESWLDGRWVVTGITTPVNKSTGEPLKEADGYLDEALVPKAFRRGGLSESSKSYDEVPEPTGPPLTDPGETSPIRKARHGRPPSRWLRSLTADEIHVWLETIDPPEAGVEGMTYWVHLTRDHGFNSTRIKGLSEADLAKLHAAAHAGY